MAEDWAGSSMCCTVLGSTAVAPPVVSGSSRYCTVLGSTVVAPPDVGSSSRYTIVLFCSAAVGDKGGGGGEGGMATVQGLGPDEA